MDTTYKLHRGSTPLLISLPHDGTQLPDELAERIAPAARLVPDTDWHMSRLYEFAIGMGASVLVPSYSRYVIDLNRPPDNASLYPGQNTTGLCPAVQFSGEAIYLPGNEPDGAEIEARRQQYWQPYHDVLREEIARLHSAHGRVALWEGHSIRSVVPFLFEGTLPAINIGTADGETCAAHRQQRIEAILTAQGDYDYVVNGRFRGGYITRHYGRPADGVDAIQLELAQANYMDEESFQYLPERAKPTQALIRLLLETLLEDRPS